ncbi:MAG: FprA family A-type flavoprotein [Methanobacteriaceae archaeon]|nr:FprA family A-type flavoprotein [Methanobacteriaceae archaeon]
MSLRTIKPNIYFLGSQDWDRILFDELITIPRGTSYNSYFILGSSKNALIDTVDPSKTHELISKLKNINVKVDYIIVNHAEQDHSGSLPEIIELYPEAVIVTNERCKELLKNLLFIPEENFLTVSDGESLSLGDKTLQFLFTPWVHWPETMVSYLKEDKILFSCDFFGSHLAESQLFIEDTKTIYSPLKRYYAEIMMPFRKVIVGNINKISKLDIDIIAPSHGPLHKNVEYIIGLYKEWISDRTKPEVILPYVSMHGSTRVMVDHLIESLMNRNMVVKPFNLTNTEIGDIAETLVDASTLIIATPTVLTGPHPLAVYVTYLTNILKPKIKYLSIIGSYGWGGRTVEHLENMLSNLNVEIIEPVLVKGQPRDEDLEKIEKLADKIVLLNKSINMVSK